MKQQGKLKLSIQGINKHWIKMRKVFGFPLKKSTNEHEVGKMNVPSGEGALLPVPLQPWPAPAPPPQEAESSSSCFSPRGRERARQHWGGLGCLYGQLNHEIQLVFCSQKITVRFYLSDPLDQISWVRSYCYFSSRGVLPLHASNDLGLVCIDCVLLSQVLYDPSLSIHADSISFALSSWTFFSTILRFRLWRGATCMLTQIRTQAYFGM